MNINILLFLDQQYDQKLINTEQSFDDKNNANIPIQPKSKLSYSLIDKQGIIQIIVYLYLYYDFLHYIFEL